MLLSDGPLLKARPAGPIEFSRFVCRVFFFFFVCVCVCGFGCCFWGCIYFIGGGGGGLLLFYERNVVVVFCFLFSIPVRTISNNSCTRALERRLVHSDILLSLPLSLGP